MNKLLKGEFPTNIHILKGQGQPNPIPKRIIEESKKTMKPDGLFGQFTFETMPKFKDVPQPQRLELFKAKL